MVDGIEKLAINGVWSILHQMSFRAVLASMTLASSLFYAMEITSIVSDRSSPLVHEMVLPRLLGHAMEGQAFHTASSPASSPPHECPKRLNSRLVPVFQVPPFMQSLPKTHISHVWKKLRLSARFP